MKRWFLFIVFLFPLVLLSNNYSITGSVIDETGNSVPEVHVTMSPGLLTTYTNKNGSFQLESVSNGTFTLYFQRIGYHNSSIVVSVNNEDVFIKKTLNRDIIDLKNVIVTANRDERNILDIPESVNLISSRDIRERNPKTSAEVLREESGIFVQKTNHGGGSAIIRGFSSNQLLLLVDGIRLNNSIYRLGNHQYLTTVDYQMLEKVEIVKGPTSILYGSDALGGTINLITRTPKLSKEKKIKIKSIARYATADKENLIFGEVEISNKRFALLSSFSLKKFGDLRRGRNRGSATILSHRLIQSPTGFKGYDINNKLIFKISQEQNLIFSNQISSQLKVPRYDKYHYNNFKLWIYQPQKRSLAYVIYENNSIPLLFDSIRMNLSLHNQNEGREFQKAELSSINKELDRAITKGFGLTGIKKTSYNHFVAGIEIYKDKISSNRYYSDLSTGKMIRASRGRYPDGSNYQSLGAFIQNDIQISKDFLVKLGLRHSIFNTMFDVNSKSNNLYSLNQAFDATTYAIGSVYKLSKEIALIMNIAQAFRAPNLSDMTKLGQSKGNIFEVPNFNIKPEQLLNKDIGIKISSSKLRLGLTTYTATVTNILTNDTTIYDGTNTILIENELFYYKTKKNLGKALIKGLELDFDYTYLNDLIFRGNFSATHGENITINEPIGGIPPIFGLFGIRLNHGIIFSDYFIRFAGKQNRLSSDDIDDPRIPIEGTPRWYTLNLRVGFYSSKNLIFQISLENILDQNYREHGSGINAPGRNLIFSLQVFH
tara:strand:- start:6223 stop:8532 length:2310 start_codon:yes stop_codon:yes gene_type:complete